MERQGMKADVKVLIPAQRWWCKRERERGKKWVVGKIRWGTCCGDEGKRGCEMCGVWCV